VQSATPPKYLDALWKVVRKCSLKLCGPDTSLAVCTRDIPGTHCLVPGLMEALDCPKVEDIRTSFVGVRCVLCSMREMELVAGVGCARELGKQLGVPPDTLRGWVQGAEINEGARPGTTTDDHARLVALEREVRELRRANAIVKAASAFFAVVVGLKDPRRRSRGLWRTGLRTWSNVGSRRPLRTPSGLPTLRNFGRFPDGFMPRSSSMCSPAMSSVGDYRPPCALTSLSTRWR
jgi:transposase-like protein